KRFNNYAAMTFVIAWRLFIFFCEIRNMLKRQLVVSIFVALQVPFCLAGAVDSGYEVSLEGAIQKAINYYPTIMQAEQQRFAQNQEVLGAEAKHWPTVGLESNTSWYADSDQDAGDNTGVLVKVPVYSGGRIEAGVRVQKALYEKAGEQVTLAEDDVVLKASSAYLGWYYAVRAVRLADANVETIDSIVKDVKSVAEYDPGRQADVYQAVVRQAKAQQEVDRQRAVLQQAEATYNRFIGELPSGEGELTDAWTMSALPPSLDVALSRVAYGHPRILAAEAEARAAQENIDVAKAQTKPELSLDVRSAHGGSASLNVTWTGFDLSARHAVSAASSSSIAAQNAVADIRLEVEESLRRSWAAMDSARARQSSAQTQVKTGEKVLQAYKDQFQVGRRSLLDLLNASDEVYTNRLSALNAEGDLYFARYQVLGTLGRLAEHY
ncbi:TolC family protein, partial [Pseudomonas sp. NPDC090755]|uniref:TolC family protein n=1 Tax=Pseudomonas sp. NPDC090755 TaxID=3364481 RepID=UPI00383BB803